MIIFPLLSSVALLDSIFSVITMSVKTLNYKEDQKDRGLTLKNLILHHMVFSSGDMKGAAFHFCAHCLVAERAQEQNLL